MAEHRCANSTGDSEVGFGGPSWEVEGGAEEGVGMHAHSTHSPESSLGHTDATLPQFHFEANSVQAATLAGLP